MAAGQHTPLRERAQIQIHGGKPALAGIEKAFHLCIRKLGAAAVGVNGQLGVVKAQLLGADLIHPSPQPHRLGSRQKPVAAGNDQVYIPGQPVGQHTQKQRGALVCEQVEIVDKKIAGRLICQRMAEIVHQQPAARSVCGAGIFPQKREARPGKGLLHGFPENGQTIGIHADANDVQRLGLGALAEIPVYRRGFAVAHRRHHRGEGAAGDGPQAFLQALGDVNGV